MYPHLSIVLCSRIDRSGGILFNQCPFVCLSAENLTCQLNIFLSLPDYSSYNAHIRYAGSFQQCPTSAGHIIKVKVEYQGYISQKMAVSGALVFHKHILLDIISLFAAELEEPKIGISAERLVSSDEICTGHSRSLLCKKEQLLVKKL